MRSAWFSAYFSFPGVHCYHEALYHRTPLEGYEHTGTADGGGYLLCPDQVAAIGPHRLVVIHRNPNTVIRRLANIGIYGAHWKPMAKKLHELDGLHVKYKDINARLQEIHEYLGLPGYSKERAELFISLNIQRQEFWAGP
jgi:hypothetical protein